MSASLAEKLERLTTPEPNTGCLLFTGGLIPAGYGMMRVGRAQLLAHRVAYELARGPIPAGLHIDHLCRQRSCCNPRHMEAVPPGVNTLRGEGPSARNARKTHCARGHELTGENLYQSPDGHRHCRACTNASKRSFYERNRERILASMAAHRAGGAQ